MKFREDINGLRAIAVLSVVIFHFNQSWLSGGFVGVDIFFVISGFLMTSIIFKGIQQEKKFSLIGFYVSRANRIIPPLFVLCFTLIILGMILLTPESYKALGKHIFSSLGFFSNIIYLRESGYFDSASHGKWLLHTWSLSVEWQFYIIYPILIIILSKFFSVSKVKLVLLSVTVLSFLFSLYSSYRWPDFSYYSLFTRSWEMMLGGLVFLYPSKMAKNRSFLFEIIGIFLIVVSCIYVTNDTLWPGYWSLIPVLGACFVLSAERDNSFVTGNFMFRKIGLWSYSIYLWHWPLVVVIFHFGLDESFSYFGVVFSIILGFLSYRFIEKIEFVKINSVHGLISCKPIYMLLFSGICGFIIFISNGFIKYSNQDYKVIVDTAKPSPLRDKCHIDNYVAPSTACSYFGHSISWATIGDSHSVEIAYALASKLREKDIGLKQFSFSSCRPSYGESDSFSLCSKWYNESVDYIINDKKIRNVVLNHRFTSGLVGGDPKLYPRSSNWSVTDYTNEVLENLDNVIIELAKNKDNVYVYYPFPELPKNVLDLITITDYYNDSIFNVVGTTTSWYKKRNEFIINHFDHAKYPNNVHLLNVKDVFCDKNNCFAVRNGRSLYFDDDHPSIYSAKLLVELIDSVDAL